MQRLVASRIQQKRREGNWSGTGAGKTLSAVLASRVVGATLTVICCPNSVVEGWKTAILNAFPDSLVATKTFAPDWAAIAGDETGFGKAAAAHRYVVLNYEAFQQEDSEKKVRKFAKQEAADFVVVDEIHFTKQRTVENLSKRKKLVTALISLAAAKNPQLCVLGMSATPVINNLQEGKSLVDMVSGLAHDDLNTRPTVAHCMKLHQRLVTLGTRWLPITRSCVTCRRRKWIAANTWRRSRRLDEAARRWSWSRYSLASAFRSSDRAFARRRCFTRITFRTLTRRFTRRWSRTAGASASLRAMTRAGWKGFCMATWMC